MFDYFIKYIFALLMGLVLIGLLGEVLGGYLFIYLFLFLFVFALFPPKYFISSNSIIHGYYFIFFIIAPMYADIHFQDDFSTFKYKIAYGMIFLTHVTAVFGASVGEGVLKKIQNSGGEIDSLAGLRIKINILYALSTSAVFLIIFNSGGLSYWMESPGDAFLNRAGSGLYVVASHFFTFILSALVGFYAYKKKSKLSLLIFVLWLLITSPVHGSKQLIAIFFLLAVLPWIRDLKFFQIKTIFYTVILLAIFALGLYFRNISWMTVDGFLPYALNYFTALRNLMILLEDFDPNFMQTFFLPFNKFLSPIGIKDLNIYYDMNHMLTDKYFPWAWEIRATEQWPVEADLYLNFYFVFGLPLIFVYTFIVGYIYGLARFRSNLGLWVVSFLMLLSITSHLRGSLYNHVDFYLYPMYFVIYLILRKYRL